MAAPLRGTQSLVGQMGWVFDRPSITAIEIAWRWIFGIPFLAVCWMQARQILAALPPEAAGLLSLDTQNPWLVAAQLSHIWTLYQPHVVAVLQWLAPASALAWAIVSGLGRSIVFRSLDTQLPFRPLDLIALQAVYILALLATFWGWFRCIEWVAATHFPSV